MAAKVYDLSAYLEEKKSTIKLGEDEYEISDGFNDLLKIDALSAQREEMGNMEFVKKFLAIALGEENAAKLIAKNYKSHVYMKIMDSVQDAISGDSQEDASNVEKAELV